MGEPDENAWRVEAFAKDPRIEEMLARFNALLARHWVADPGAMEGPADPIVLVVGPPRSGTTLLMQRLARHTDAQVADNIVARFWGAPDVGIHVSRSLRAQLADAAIGLSSTYGVTHEPFGPHEFGYFWTRFFDFGDGHALDAGRLAQVDWPALDHALRAMQHAAGPHTLALKAVPLSCVAAAVGERLPRAVFVRTRRDRRALVRSILTARRARYGTEARWWSLRPQGTLALQARPPLEQVVGQVLAIERDLDEQLARLDPARHIEVDYRETCAAPDDALDRIGALVGRHGGRLALRRGEGERIEPKDRAPADALDAQIDRLLAGMCPPSPSSGG